MTTLFGTDGIRGVAGDRLSPELAMQVGRAAAVVLAERHGEHPLFLVGRDTRLSGPMLEAALVAGITSAGGRAEIAGIMPTPGLAALVVKRGADAGVVISASHNPFDDNGIKFFSDEGLKLSDEEEAEIETRVASGHLSVRSGTGIGSAETIEGALESYVWDVVRRIPLDLSGLRIAVDCANGAMYRAAPLGLSESGADVAVLCADPDGRNINAGCGSTHIEGLQRGGAPRRVRSGAGLRRRRRPRARRRLDTASSSTATSSSPSSRPISRAAERLRPRHRRDDGDDQPGLPPRDGARRASTSSPRPSATAT